MRSEAMGHIVFSENAIDSYLKALEIYGNDDLSIYNYLAIEDRQEELCVATDRKVKIHLGIVGEYLESQERRLLFVELDYIISL